MAQHSPPCAKPGWGLVDDIITTETTYKLWEPHRYAEPAGDELEAVRRRSRINQRPRWIISTGGVSVSMIATTLYRSTVSHQPPPLAELNAILWCTYVGSQTIGLKAIDHANTNRDTIRNAYR